MSRSDRLVAPTGALPSVSRVRRLRDRVATALVWASVVAAAVPLALVLGYVVFKGVGVISWDFLTSDIGPVRRAGGGMGPAIVGTLLITTAAACMAIPIGILAAISLVEFERSNPVSGLVRFLSDVMAGVPSIVMGLFVYTVWVLRFREQSAFAGALALASLMLPIVVRSTETMLRLVPQDLRDGARALGSNRSVVVLRVVLPAALPGIVSGCLLAIARAAGETAPLLFTIGVIYTANLNPFEGTNTALSTQIFSNAQQPFEAAQGRAWGAALTLIVLVMVLTALARLFIRRFARR